MISQPLAASARSWAIGAALLVLFMVGLLKVLAPFLEGLAWGIILVFMTWPIYRWLHIRLRIGEGIASILMTVGVGGILLLALVPIAAELGEELRSVSNRVKIGTWSGMEELVALPALELAARRLQIDDASAMLLETLGGISLDITGRAAQIALESLTSIGIMIFSSYFFFRHGRVLLDELQSVLTRFTSLNWPRIFTLTGGTIKAVVYGAVATALAQGLLAGIGYYVVAAPIPALLGIVTMLLSFVPFGAPLVYIPVSLHLALSVGDWFAGIGLLIWGVLVVSTIDNILRPLFISQSIKLPLLVVFIGVVGGIFAFGFLGLFMGPVLVALAHAAWRELVENSTKEGKGQALVLAAEAG